MGRLIRMIDHVCHSEGWMNDMEPDGSWGVAGLGWEKGKEVAFCIALCWLVCLSWTYIAFAWHGTVWHSVAVSRIGLFPPFYSIRFLLVLLSILQRYPPFLTL